MGVRLLHGQRASGRAIARRTRRSRANERRILAAPVPKRQEAATGAAPQAGPLSRAPGTVALASHAGAGDGALRGTPQLGFGAGAERIRERSLFLTQVMIDAADARGLEVRTPRDPDRRGGAVTIHHPDGARLRQELEARGVICDHRPGAGLRFGPHFYNSAEECERAVGLLADLAS